MSASTHHSRLPVRSLYEDGLLLSPFETTKHASLLVEGTAGTDNESLFKYLPWGPFTTAEDLTEWYETKIENNPSNFLFAILHEGVFAGIVGLRSTLVSDVDRETQIGYLLVLPRFQGTGLATKAVGLILQYAFDPAPKGLQMEIVRWYAKSSNVRAIRLAERLGFTLGIRGYSVDLDDQGREQRREISGFYLERGVWLDTRASLGQSSLRLVPAKRAFEDLPFTEPDLSSSASVRELPLSSAIFKRYRHGEKNCGNV